MQQTRRPKQFPEPTLCCYCVERQNLMFGGHICCRASEGRSHFVMSAGATGSTVLFLLKLLRGTKMCQPACSILSQVLPETKTKTR